jgi:hypothetical protein
MPLHIFDVVTLSIGGLLVGNELTVAVFLHPLLYRLPTLAHAATAKAIAALFGRVMPFWYASTAVLTLMAAWLHRASPLLLTASVLWVLAIVFSIFFPVPINNRIARWNLATLPENWLSERRRWDRLHQFRTLALLVAFICQLSALTI